MRACAESELAALLDRVNSSSLKISDIAEEEMQAALLLAHFNELHEDACFEVLFIPNPTIQKLASKQFIKCSQRLLLAGQKFIEVYSEKNLLSVLRHSDPDVQELFMEFYTCANAQHPRWEIFKNVDLSRFLDSPFVEVRRVMAGVISFQFVDEAMVQKGLNDASEFVRKEWLKRNNEIERMRLRNKQSTMLNAGSDYRDAL